MCCSVGKQAFGSTCVTAGLSIKIQPQASLCAVLTILVIHSPRIHRIALAISSFTAMQISLDRIEFYQSSYQPSAAAPSFIDLTTPDSLRRSVCKLPRNEALSMPDERAERQRLRSHQPADENAIVISDDDGCDDDDGDGNARDIPAPVPERQPSTADEGGILSSRSVSNFRADSICGPVVDPHHIEAFSQHPEKARDNVVFAGDGDSSTYCTLQAPSSLVLPALLPAPGASASEDDHDMGRVRTPSELVSSPAYDVLQPSLPHTGGSQDSSSYVSQASSDGSDAEGPERTLSPSPLRAEPLDQIIVTTTIDPTEGLAGSAASLLASSLSSQLSPSICEGLQLVQRDLQDTRRAQKYASCPNTTSNAFFASKNTVMATCTSPCDTAFVSAPFTTPRQRGRTRGPPLPSSVKRTRRTLPAHGFSQRRSARLRSTSSNALDAYIQHEANQNSESNIGPSSLDGSGSDESYTARSINSTEERSDSGLDEIDMPSPKRRKASPPQIAAAQRRSLRHSSRLSAAPGTAVVRKMSELLVLLPRHYPRVNRLTETLSIKRVLPGLRSGH